MNILTHVISMRILSIIDIIILGEHLYVNIIVFDVEHLYDNKTIFQSNPKMYWNELYLNSIIDM